MELGFDISLLRRENFERFLTERPRYEQRMERQELWCHDCERYVQFDVDIHLDGEFLIRCPNCGHEHCRIVRDGRITDIRWSQRNNVQEARVLGSSVNSMTTRDGLAVVVPIAGSARPDTNRRFRITVPPSGYSWLSNTFTTSTATSAWMNWKSYTSTASQLLRSSTTTNQVQTARRGTGV